MEALSPLGPVSELGARKLSSSRSRSGRDSLPSQGIDFQNIITPERQQGPVR
jgi:hypothetical protein